MGFDFAKTIKGKLIGIIVIALVVALGVSSLLIYLNAKQALTSSTEQSIKTIAMSSSKETGLWLDGKKDYFLTLANTAVVENANRAQMRPYLTKEFQRIHKGNDYELLFFADANGDSCNTLTELQNSPNIANKAYFKKVMATGNVEIELRPSAVTGNPVAVIAAPIKKAGKVIGVVGGSIKLDELIQRISMVKVGQTGYAYVVRGDGLVIIHPDKKLVMKNNLLTDNNNIDPNLREAIGRMVQGKEGVAQYSWENVDKYMSFAPVPGMEWSLAVTVPVAEVTEQLSTVTKISLIAPILIAIVIIIITSIVLTRLIIRPLSNLQEVMVKVEAGDFRTRGEIKSEDELGALTGAVNRTLDVLSGMIRDIRDATGNLKKSSMGLVDISTNVAANSQEMSAKICTVSATVEEISANIEETASSTEEVSHGVEVIAKMADNMSASAQNAAKTSEYVAMEVKQASTVVEGISDSISRVAASAGEVSSSMNNIAQTVHTIDKSLHNVNRKCERSIGITVEAQDRSHETTAIIHKLNSTSRQINKIVDVIRGIAEQTNMLALNATIEAAGAGEAGKGFAVVAAEVKELAKRTAEETRHIAQQIEDMQNDMSEAVTAVEKIADVIAETNDITRTIASDVTEQSQSVGEISSAMALGVNQVMTISKEIKDVAVNAEQVAQSVTEAANGVKAMFDATVVISHKSDEVAENTGKMATVMSNIVLATKEVAQGTQEIVENVQEADNATADTAEKASQTSGAAYDLGEMAKRLEVLVGKFKV